MTHDPLIEVVAASAHQGCTGCDGRPSVAMAAARPWDTAKLDCPTLQAHRDAARACATAITTAGWRILRFEPVIPMMVERTERIAGEWTPEPWPEDSADSPTREAYASAGYRDALHRLDPDAAGRRIAATPAPTTDPTELPADLTPAEDKVVDLMAALEESVRAAKASRKRHRSGSDPT